MVWYSDHLDETKTRYFCLTQANGITNKSTHYKIPRLTNYVKAIVRDCSRFSHQREKFLSDAKIKDFWVNTENSEALEQNLNHHEKLSGKVQRLNR